MARIASRPAAAISSVLTCAPCARRTNNWVKSSGRGRLPACVVRIRSVLRRIGSPVVRRSRAKREPMTTGPTEITPTAFMGPAFAGTTDSLLQPSGLDVELALGLDVSGEIVGQLGRGRELR